MGDRTATDAYPFVLCVGIAALDLIMDVETLPAEDGRVRSGKACLAGGGPAATAAVAMSRLGTNVRFVGAVGPDPAGRLIRDELARERVDVSELRVMAEGTSPMSMGIVRSAAGTRTLVAYPGSGTAIEVTPAIEAASRAASWIHADHSSFGVVRELRRRGVETLVSIDGGNPIPDLDLSLIDLYAPAAPELLRWTGAATVDDGLARARADGAAVAIATCGESGSMALTGVSPERTDLTDALRWPRRRDPETNVWKVQQPSVPIPVTGGSTLGAGDVYHGALLAAILRGRSLADSMAFASAAAALSCGAIDSRSAIPTVAEVDAVIDGRSPAGHAAVSRWS